MIDPRSPFASRYAGLDEWPLVLPLRRPIQWSVETASCIECMDEVDELSGWETTSGKVLCAACFATLYGVQAARRFDAAAERPPRPAKPEGVSRIFWMTGADGQEIHTNAFRIAGGGRNG